MKLSNALDAFILEQQLRGNTEKTIRGYKGFISQFVTWLETCNINEVSAITLKHTQGYQLNLNTRRCENKNQKLTRRTVRTYMRHIRIFLAFCFDEGFINEPIHQKIKLPKAEKPAIEIINNNEADYLLSVFGDDILAHRNRAIVYLMLDCGLRLSEVSGIKTNDINLANGYIKVMGKGRKGRIVPIGKKVCKAIQAYKHVRPDSISDNIFLSIHERPITANGIAQMINRLKKQTGISRLHAHLLRHTFATNFLIYNLGDVYELSRILGHSDIRITEGYVQLASYYTMLQNRNRQTYLDIKEMRTARTSEASETSRISKPNQKSP